MIRTKMKYFLMKKFKLPLTAAFSLMLTSVVNAQVGIGTGNPTQILDIESANDTSTAIHINSTGTGDPQIEFQLSGTTLFTLGVDNSDGDKFKIGTTDLETNTSITVISNGNVGINDNTPAYSLEVDGDINLSFDTSAYRINGNHAFSQPNTRNLYAGRDAGNEIDPSGTDNTFIGYQAGFSNTEGDQNVYIGSGAGYSGTTGGSNTVVGYQAGYSNTAGEGNVFLGYQAGYNETGSNKLYIDNTNTTTPLIYGDFANDVLTINGSLVVNEQSADEDFRVESENLTHMLFVDASNDQVLVGTSNGLLIGGQRRDLQVSATTNTAGIGLVRHSDNTGSARLSFIKARGAEGSPTGVNDGDVLGMVEFFGFDGTDYSSEGAHIRAEVAGTPGADDFPTKLVFSTTPDGSASASDRMTITAAGFVGIGEVAPSTRLYVEEDAATVATFNRTGSEGTIIDLQQDGTSEGGIEMVSGVLTYTPFTGSHYGASNASFEMGYLVSLTGENEHYNGNETSEVLYGIQYTQKQNDPNVLGSYLSLLNPVSSYTQSNPHLIMAVGNGSMWVTNSGGEVAIGDYLISSSVEGCAMKDTQNEEVSYIVARAAEPIDWSKVAADENGVKKVLISVFYESFKKYNYQVKLQKLRDEVEFIKAALND